MNDKIRIWDSHNNQWLEPMTIYFGKDNVIWKVAAIIKDEDPLSDGWYDLEGDDLEKIAIVGGFNYNEHLVPLDERNKFDENWERIK